VDALRTAAKAEPGPGRGRAMLLVELLAEGGLRIGEALGLSWDAVALDAGAEGLRLERTKGRADRVVPLVEPSRLLRLLRAAARRQPKGRVLPAAHGGPWSYAGARRTWGRICRGAKVRATLHQLRHTRATELVRAGAGLSTVQRFLGHARPDTTAIYVQITSDDVRRELQRVKPR
jgi:integrase